MKKIVFICALAVAAFTTSCDTNTVDSSKYRSTFFFTAHEVEDQEFEIYFESDAGEKLHILTNNSTADLSEIADGTRVAVEVIVEDSEIPNFDYSVEVYKIHAVLMGECSTVNSEEAEAAIADDELSYVFSTIGLYKGYLNMLVGYKTADVENAKFHLLINNLGEPEVTEDGYINLELRYDAADSDSDDSDDSDEKTTSTAKEYDSYLSFDLEQLRGSLEGNAGIILRIKTKNSDTKYIKLESDDMY